MKCRILAASFMLAFVVPIAHARVTEVSYVKASPSLPHARVYVGLYRQVVRKFNARTPGRNILNDGLRSGKVVTDADLARSIRVLRRMLAPPPAPVVSYTAPAQTQSTYTPTASYSSSGGEYSNVPGVPASFAACVARTESTDGAGSSNIYGIEGSGGSGSLAEQKAAFAQMYATRGVNPWQPYDGCSG